ncbi:MAG: hypothetical protein U5L09_14990 [Bacteroidales bacterium]|nr:hypothetical protein [Bacteroidales bacterium]
MVARCRNNPATSLHAITIVEINGNQSAISAFQSNPFWFKQDNIRSPLFQYPIQARKLKNEQPYAWKVTAYNGENEISESEVWSFVHVREEQEDSDEEEVRRREKKKYSFPINMSAFTAMFITLVITCLMTIS